MPLRKSSRKRPLDAAGSSEDWATSTGPPPLAADSLVLEIHEGEGEGDASLSLVRVAEHAGGQSYSVVGGSASALRRVDRTVLLTLEEAARWVPEKVGYGLKVGVVRQQRSEAAKELEDELLCGVCLGLLCRPHVLPCGHTFCGQCIFKHDQLSSAEQLTCPTCRQPLPPQRPALQPQLNDYLDRIREALSLEEVCSESLDDYRVRRRAWDARKEDWYKHWKGKHPERPTMPPDAQLSTLHIKVVNLLGEGRGHHPEVVFRLLATTPFGRLTSAYCERQEIERRLVSFKYRGVEVRDVQTPESLHMVDNDRLDAFWVPTLRANQRASRLSTLRHRTGGSGTIGAPPSAASDASPAAAAAIPSG